MNARPVLPTLVAACIAAALSAAASAQPATTHLRIEKIYSTLDGQAQAVELRIVRIGDEPLVLTRRPMIVRDRRGNTRAVPLHGNAGGYAPYGDRDRILLGTLADDWGPYSDVVMPVATLPIDGGTISIEGWDEVGFGRLPEDGRHAVDRDGNVVPATFEIWGSWDIVETVVSEFHHAGLDHYFMTNRADEIALLLSGAIPGWRATGKRFMAYARPRGPDLRPVCRYMLDRPESVSHFFSASEAECAAASRAAGNVLELASAFLALLPDDGRCGMLALEPPDGDRYLVGTSPIYRLWNGKPDTNHRFVADRIERDAMVARGWISEGAGADGIAMCAHDYVAIAP